MDDWGLDDLQCVATAGPLDYTPAQWTQIGLLRKAANEHANAESGEACGWRPAEPDLPIDMVAPDLAPMSEPALREKLMAMLKEDQASRDVMLATESPIRQVRRLKPVRILVRRKRE